MAAEAEDVSRYMRAVQERIMTIREGMMMATGLTEASFGREIPRGIKIEPRAVWGLERGQQINWMQHHRGSAGVTVIHPRACACCGAPYEPKCSYCQRTDYNAGPAFLSEAVLAVHNPHGMPVMGQKVAYVDTHGKLVHATVTNNPGFGPGAVVEITEG